MKTRIYILVAFIVLFFANAQKTNKITIDVDNSTIKQSHTGKWLSVKSNEMAVIELVGINPFKYNYFINTHLVSFFEDAKNGLNNDFDNIVKAVAEKGKEESKKELYDEKDIDKNNDSQNKAIDELNKEVEEYETAISNISKLNTDEYKIKIKIFSEKAKKNLSKAYEYKECYLGIKATINEEKREDYEKKLDATIEKATKSLNKILDTFFTIKEDNKTLPIDIQGKNIDVLQFDIKRADRKTNQVDQNFGKQPYNIWVKGGMKIDISAGVFVTTLKDKEYLLKTNTSGDINIVENDKGKYDFAFGSTVNTNFRINSWVQPSLNFGIIFTANQKFQMIAGAGVIMGREQRWILNGGISMGVVKELDNRYSKDTLYKSTDFPNSIIPDKDKFSFGHFIGITYNLSGVKKMEWK